MYDVQGHPARPSNLFTEVRDFKGVLTGNILPKVPFPSHTPHNEQFRRSRDFFSSAPIPKAQLVKIPEEYQPELQDASQYMAKDDECYNRWKAKQEKDKVEQQKLRQALAEVPREISELPGHYAPPTETSSQVIGQYLDLQPRPPLVYPDYEHDPVQPPTDLKVKYISSNFSNLPSIPDHGFILPMEKLLSHDGKRLVPGFKGANFKATPPGQVCTGYDSFRTSALTMGDHIVGERLNNDCSFSPCGLEFNRVWTGAEPQVGGTELFPRRLNTDLKTEDYYRHAGANCCDYI